MNGNSSPEPDRDGPLNAILLDFVEAVQRGERPDRQRLLDSYPEYAPRLAAFFATRDRLDRLTAPLRAPASRSAQSSGTGTGGPFPTAAVGRVGDFRLLREVGRGGMGVVYEAEQVSLRRRVALKVLPFAAAIDPRHLQRFRNEAQAAAQLHHSNIVPVFAVGAEGGVHYYAMQFIDGQSLAQLLSGVRDAGGYGAAEGLLEVSSDGSVSLGLSAPPEARSSTIAAPAHTAAISTEHATRRRAYFRRMVGLVRQAAEALEYAHQFGVVHRDVKPANLLLDATGRLWVADFGLALIRNAAGVTATGELVGTVRYMSPEQATGIPGLVDHRTDV